MEARSVCEATDQGCKYAKYTMPNGILASNDAMQQIYYCTQQPPCEQLSSPIFRSSTSKNSSLLGCARRKEKRVSDAWASSSTIERAHRNFGRRRLVAITIFRGASANKEPDETQVAGDDTRRCCCRCRYKT
jgi:hypothetical protein